MEPRAGCRLPARVEQVANGALVVTVSCGGRSFAGILLDCTKKSGLFGLPLPVTEDCPALGCHGPTPQQGDGEAAPPGAGVLPAPRAHQPAEGQPRATTGPEPPPPAGSPPPGSPLAYPPYFEGAPFPRPLWLRKTYQQWVPQPPPRAIKRSRRRLSRSRAPGRLALSTIRLRPRQVLCAKCQSAVGPPEAGPGAAAPTRARRRLSSGSAPARPPPEGPEEEEEEDGGAAATGRQGRRERRGEERVPRSPVITISYSTPQGTGEVVKIPSRVHGSLEPFRPPPPHGGSPRPGASQGAALGSPAVPRPKLARPLPAGPDPPPPKIRLKPRRPRAGARGPLYRAELVGELGASPRASPPGLLADGSARARRDAASGSSGEDDDDEDVGRCPRGPQGAGGLAFLVSCPERKAGRASEPVCGSDSLDESRSSGSEAAASPDAGATGPSCPAAGRTVPPLTVRLHTHSVSKCVTDDGRTVAVGDVVWGKIHGFPWWPARVLDISLGQKGDGEPSWQEAKVSWFGSPTTSFLSISKLAPFSEFFKLRFNRKKRGMYRRAITEAANAARHVAPEIRELLTQFEA
ncbi:PWWP domain-containing protein 2B [Ctenodactylus gundi]